MRAFPAGTMETQVKPFLVLVSLIAVVLQGHPAYCFNNSTSHDLTTLGLEQLLNVKVISASKNTAPLSDTAAAITVINQEDIRRSGATTIPEILRLVPGLQVASLDANKWAISARGFNNRFSDKLLVLMDGRTLYSPIHGGVYWDIQDTLLEDIDHIEVIRGPGATLWGANAMNGIINIITKNSADTKGSLISTGIGTNEKFFTSMRHGGDLSETLTYRIYAKYFDRDGFVDETGEATGDDWQQVRGGFRLDWREGFANDITLQGDIYDGLSGQTKETTHLSSPHSSVSTEDVDVHGANLLGRWKHTCLSGSRLELQLYYDHAERSHSTFDEWRETLDLDFQHTFSPWSDHSFVWGGGYRHISDQLVGTWTISYSPEQLDYYRANFFFQDDITLIEDQLHLILGSKFEGGDFLDFAVQPNLKLLWKIDGRNTLWTSISRAIRAVTRTEKDMELQMITFTNRDGGVTTLTLFGNDDLKSKSLLALDAGYRTNPFSNLFFDISFFYNVYDHLRFIEYDRTSTDEAGNTIIAYRVEDTSEGTSYGMEVSAKVQVTRNWQLTAGYSYLHMDIDSDTEIGEVNYGNDQPKHQFNLTSRLDLPYDVEFDATLYYVDQLESLQIDDYVRLDLRLGWQPLETLELSLLVSNLLDNHHAEFGWADGVLPSEVERGIYVKLTSRF